MTILGFGEGAVRFALFVSIFVLMALAETFWPRRPRRFGRVRRWSTNFGVLAASYALTFVSVLIVPVTATLTAIWAEASGFGLFHFVALPQWLAFLLTILVLDLTIWSQHVVTHRVPLLWRLHRVHHTDEDLDASSAIRFHPLEILFSIFVKSAVVALIGAPALAVVAFEALVNGSALFNHANVRLPGPVDRLVRLIFVTPDMHRVHHSVIRSETDSNFGFALSLWDRLFGTYVAQPAAGHDGMIVGLEEWQDEAPTRLGWALALPFWSPPLSKRPQGTSADRVHPSARSA